MLLTFKNLEITISAQLQASCDPKHEWLPKITIVEHFKKKTGYLRIFLNIKNQPIKEQNVLYLIKHITPSDVICQH